MVGEILENSNGQKYVVLERAGQSKSGNVKWKIRFVSTGYETVVEKVQMKRGKIKDRYARDIFGIGYIGDTDAVSHKKEYNVWHKMLQRCYDTSCKSFKDYGAKGVAVHPRWHSFENFVNDIPLIDGYDKEQFGIGGLNLDKDLKQPGVQHKIYSLDTCTFMTKAENNALIDREERKKEFKAVSPTGEIFIVAGVGEFAREHGLIRQGITNCLQSRAKHHQGWTFTY